MRRNWTREEVLVAFNLYCRTPFGRLHARNPEIILVAKRIGRTPSALAMKCCNLASFDPALRERGIKGLTKTSAIDSEIWSEFERHPEELGFESELAISRLTRTKPRLEKTVEWDDVQGLDREAITRVRVNQHLFRSIVLAGYDCTCAVCSLPLSQLLVASHIVPWSVDRSQRMNPRNGICLCILHDKAFDAGLLIITSEYCVELSPAIWKLERLDSVRQFFTSYAGKPIRLPERWHPDPLLLQRHIGLFK